MKTSLCVLFSVLLLGCARDYQGTVAFHSSRDGNFEIYTMRADGSGQVRLTNNASNDITPVWSPDGSRIAFASDRDGTWDIYTMNADGSDLKQLTRKRGTNTAPSWSADGREVVFVSTRDSVISDIYRIKADGSNEHRVTADSLVKDSPLMLPGGQGYVATVNDRGRFLIVRYDAEGRQHTALTTEKNDNQYPALSSDGKQVLFSSNRDGTYQIYVMEFTGTGQRRLTTDNADNRNPCPTSAAEVILAAKKGGIYQIDLKTNKELVLSFKGDYAPSWHSR